MTGKLNFRGFIDSLVADLLRLQIRKGLFNLFGIGSMTGSVPSGDGGGFTGMGARVGGIDGKGGFPAILHPNETVVDHTKGQSVGSTNINFTIQATDTSGFDQLLTSRKNQIVAMISQAMNQRGKTGLI
jgi:phage-related minor tail protein